MLLDDTARQFLSILHQGGQYAYWWTIEGRQSFWWPVGRMPELPSGRKNIYVGVHATTSIPATSPRGEAAEPRNVRAQLPYIAAINCLYCEYDAKDFGGDKEQARKAAESMTPPASVITDSGGGYHVYHLLDEPWILATDDDRQRAKRLQAAWVAYAGSDPQVKDLARVLRVPGTINYKYDPPRPVAFLVAALDRRYRIEDLETVCAHLMEPERPVEIPAARVAPEDHQQRYARAALDREVVNVLRAPAGGKHDVIRNAALKLGTLVPILSEDEIITELTRAADLHREDVRDTYRTVLDGIAYGKQRPRVIPRPASSIPLRQISRTTGEILEPEQQPRDDGLPILIRADDLHLIPPAEELVCDLLYVNTLHQIFGAPGGGKSFLALDIAATVAQTRRVVYVAAEAIEDYESRLDAWQIHHKASAGDLYFWREPLTLASEGDVRRFIAMADDPALVVIDPLVDCLTGLDESNGRDMGVALYALNTIRRHTRAAVLIVHHTGWVDDHERGHSSLRAACRVVGKVDAREDGLIRLVCEKKNHGKKFDPRSFRLVSLGTMGGALILPARMVMPGKIRLTDKLLKVMEAMTTEPLRGGATHTELLKDTAIPAGTLNRVLTSLADAGYIRAEDSGRSRKYYLTTEGRQALTLSFEEQNESGRTLEDSGSGWNWKVVSSTGLAHNKEVLPNASISLPPTPLSPLRGGKGVAGEFQSSSISENGENGYHPPVYAEPTVKGYRELGGYDGSAAEDELFPDTPAAVVTTPAIPAAPPVSTFNLEHVRRLLDTQNVAALVTHYRLNRRQDVAGLTTDDIVDLAMQEAGAE